MQKMIAGPAASMPAWETLETFARAQVQGLIQQLLEDEMAELLGRVKSKRRAALDAPAGSRNGHGKPRQLALMNGTITVRRPRVRDMEECVVSRFLPLFQRRTPEVSALLPELYLHRLALGDFELALRGLLGDAAPLSANSLVRLKATSQAQYTAWHERDLSDVELVYLWADGVYVKAGLHTSKAALLMLIGADAEGEKMVLAVESRQRKSTESWAALLRDLKRRGLRASKLTIADRHLRIWSGLVQVYPEGAEQRCWNHKLRNVLDTVPQTHQAEVKARARLRADDSVLRVPEGTLAVSAHDERDRISIRCGSIVHHTGEALPESRECNSSDLEIATGRRAPLSETERSGPLQGGVQPRFLSRWHLRHHPTPKAVRRLTLITHLLTKTQLLLSSQQVAKA